LGKEEGRRKKMLVEEIPSRKKLCGGRERAKGRQFLDRTYGRGVFSEVEQVVVRLKKVPGGIWEGASRRIKRMRIPGNLTGGRRSGKFKILRKPVAVYNKKKRKELKGKELTERHRR